ncbi:MAG: CDF family Co(II)/Ni(II) efflux transporter DmeF [Xanthobacteraceae bacterium]
MHGHSLQAWQHGHVFLGAAHDRHERRTWLVVVLTTITMIAEIVAGTVYGSMALTADGWHMSTHAAALAISALAYRFARKHADDSRFSFGTGKLGELAAFASAIILALIAVLIGYESAIRLFAPVPIRFDEALLVVVLGLAVNLLSAWLLWEGSGQLHGHEHHDGNSQHHHHGHDSNIRAAFAHVSADALTSVLAIAALLGGRFYGWTWLDSAIGIVGAVIITRWSYGLIVSSGATLLDIVPDWMLASKIRTCLEVGGDRLGDLHLWRLGPGHAGVIVSVISDHPQEPEAYKRRLSGIEGLSHVSVEVHQCRDRVGA